MKWTAMKWSGIALMAVGLLFVWALGSDLGWLFFLPGLAVLAAGLVAERRR